MNDERLLLEMRRWLQEERVTLPDAEQASQQIASQLPATRQRRRRWWRLPFRARTPKPPGAIDTTDYQPSPIPATNGHTPTVIGRTSSMLSPAKAITAGALVFAIGSAFLIAQPFQQAASVPGAGAPPVEPTWVTGTGHWAPSCSGPESTEVDGDVTRERGRVCEPTRWEMSDPRLTGEASWRWSADQYGTADGPKTVIHGAEYLRNEGGGWTCPIVRLAGYSSSNPSQYNSSDVQLCVGDGGYEGLSALIVAGENDLSTSLVGLIFSGDIPPLPDPPAAE